MGIEKQIVEKLVVKAILIPEVVNQEETLIVPTNFWEIQIFSSLIINDPGYLRL